MAKTRQEIMDEATELIDDQVRILKDKGRDEVLKPADAKVLADYLRVLSLVEKDRRDAKREDAGDAAKMTDEELEAELIKAAEAVKVKRGGTAP